eukprot:TRINITY_DN189_c0_g1_i6.p1 TRINITY_DN189_c0_g1~~TRINITY_DN189_c0_g1_i6.p1  ORF type:complete len:432 (+),score=50.83 TRINITY_DN189_c0_g1_i6:133-1296(+)
MDDAMLRSLPRKAADAAICCNKKRSSPNCLIMSNTVSHSHEVHQNVSIAQINEILQVNENQFTFKVADIPVDQMFTVFIDVIRPGEALEELWINVFESIPGTSRFHYGYLRMKGIAKLKQLYTAIETKHCKHFLGIKHHCRWRTEYKPRGYTAAEIDQVMAYMDADLREVARSLLSEGIMRSTKIKSFPYEVKLQAGAAAIAIDLVKEVLKKPRADWAIYQHKTELIQRIESKTFDYYRIQSSVLQFSNLQVSFLPKLRTYVGERFGPKAQYIYDAMAVGADVRAMDISGLFAKGSGADIAYINFLGSGNADGSINVLIASGVLGVTLTPNFVVYRDTKDVMGIYHREKDVIVEEPRGITTEEITQLLTFTEIVTLERLEKWLEYEI